jgi:hypothetical protein
MPVKLSHIAKKTATVTLCFDEQQTDENSLNIEYYPNLLTDELVLGWQEAKNNGEEDLAEYARANNEQILSLIKSWDLLEDDGKTTIPLTPEAMLKVSYVIKAQIMQAIMEEMANPETTASRVKRS